MAQQPEPKRRRRASLAEADTSVGIEGFSLAGVFGLFGGFTRAVSESGWNVRTGMVVVVIGLLLGTVAFIAYGGGILSYASDARFAGASREFWTCRYVTLAGTESRRIWKADAKGCPVLLMP